MSTLIYCDEAIYAGTDCLPSVENIDIPTIGLCEECITKKKHHRERRSQEAPSNEEHAPTIGTDANKATTMDANIQSQEYNVTYADWNCANEPDADQLDGLDITCTKQLVQQWLNNLESPVTPSSVSMSSYDVSPQSTPRSQRSYIPVPVRKIRPKAQTKTQPCTQHSGIPVPVHLLQNTRRESTQPLSTIGMRLFDQVTF